jgi:hypothetical protein
VQHGFRVAVVLGRGHRAVAGSTPFWSTACSVTWSGPTSPPRRRRSRIAALIARASPLVGALTVSV